MLLCFELFALIKLLQSHTCSQWVTSKLDLSTATYEVKLQSRRINLIAIHTHDVLNEMGGARHATYVSTSRMAHFEGFCWLSTNFPHASSYLAVFCLLLCWSQAVGIIYRYTFSSERHTKSGNVVHVKYYEGIVHQHTICTLYTVAV